MIRTWAEQKIDGKYNILTYEPMREKNTFYITYIPLLLRLELMEYFYPKILLNDVTVYNYSKQIVMSASDYIDTANRDVRILIWLT